VVEVNLARGMRDFLPESMRRRQWVIDRVRAVFERHGFEPLETPAMERLETLTGKYGDEGEHLLFRVLKRGEGGQEGEADLGLRYDLTVPLARVLAMNQELPLPFRRWQVQPVWRADRPQRGRFREFLQCDVDIAGSESPVADAECLAVVHEVLSSLGFREFSIRVNHRILLEALVEVLGEPSVRVADVLATLDKLDKIGRNGVNRELQARGIGPCACDRLWEALDRVDPTMPPIEALDALRPGLPPRALPGIENLRDIFDHVRNLGVPDERVRFDPTLARGLDYYTGAVFETEVLEPRIGSLSGGGRYDRLVGMFLGRDIPAVGVSLGLERIVTVMEEQGMFPTDTGALRVWVAALESTERASSAQIPDGLLGRDAFLPELQAALRLATLLRREGHATLVSPEPVKARKLFRQASARGVPFVAFVGSKEAADGVVSLKRLRDGEQWTLPPSRIPGIVAEG
jgi:histidyl-tRNA synthetase